MSTCVPAPRIADPRDAPPLRWGVAGPGGIAGDFARALLAHTRQRLTAVGSRSADRAAAFAAEHDIALAFGSYAELAASPEVDVVYVASVNSAHLPVALTAIEAGKHVLVEKPLAADGSEARWMADAARASGVLLVEAMKTRFLPRIDVVRQIIGSGALGELAWVSADIGRRMPGSSRLLDPALGGGALMDLGSYAVALVVDALGAPGSITASGVLAETGVDRQMSIQLGGFAAHPAAQAHVHTSMVADTSGRAVIAGTDGRIEIDAFHGPGPVHLALNGGAPVAIDVPGLTGRSALAHEIAHVADVVHAGLTESPLMPLADSIAAMDVIDAARRQVGVEFEQHDLVDPGA